jgi:N-acetyl-gamma-glutamylphosphate reductase
MAHENEILHAMMNGIKFTGEKMKKEEDPNKVKTKARIKAYKTGTHKSGAAKHKAEIKQRVKQRASQRRKK